MLAVFGIVSWTIHNPSREIISSYSCCAIFNSTPMAAPQPVSHEQWDSETEPAMLEAATRFIKRLEGAVIEIGCREGRSAMVIAKACYPDNMFAIDTWASSVSEHPDHNTLLLAKVRDVFAAFIADMQCGTRGNSECHRLEAITFLKGWPGPMKFFQIDAAHD
jgi:hypothetical protein